jgi:putative transposase
MLRERFGVSQRRACRVVGQHRSTQRLDPPTPSEEEQRLRAWLRAFSKRRPRWGWRRAAKAARREGWKVNDKRIQRLWRDEGLKVPYASARSPTAGSAPPSAPCARSAQMPYTRECPAIVVDCSIDADKVVATLDRLMLTRGAPAFVRFDNGPEFIAAAVADWCRFNGVGTVFIDPGSPWLSRVIVCCSGSSVRV